MRTAKFQAIFMAMAILCLAGAGWAHGQSSNRGKDRQQNDNIEKVVFKDSAGRVKRELRLENREFTEKGKKIRQKMKAMRSKDEKFIVVQNERRDVNEMDPYKIRFSSGMTLTWYDSTGTEISKKMVGNRAYVDKISDTGNALVLIDEGFEDVEFEKYYVTGQTTTKPLKEDAQLKTTYLYVVNNKWETLYSTTSRKGGWGIVMISPSGKWLVLEERQPGQLVGGEWKYFLTVIDIANARAYLPEWNRDAWPEMVNDAGKITARKIIGKSKAKHKVKSYDGSLVEVQKQVYEEYVWEPGMNSFTKTGSPKEEE